VEILKASPIAVQTEWEVTHPLRLVLPVINWKIEMENPPVEGSDEWIRARDRLWEAEAKRFFSTFKRWKRVEEKSAKP
jgi:hypothetical protein